MHVRSNLTRPVLSVALVAIVLASGISPLQAQTLSDARIRARQPSVSKKVFLPSKMIRERSLIRQGSVEHAQLLQMARSFRRDETIARIQKIFRQPGNYAASRARTTVATPAPFHVMGEYVTKGGDAYYLLSQEASTSTFANAVRVNGSTVSATYRWVQPFVKNGKPGFLYSLRIPAFPPGNHTIELVGDLVMASSSGASLDGDLDGRAGGNYTTTLESRLTARSQPLAYQNSWTVGNDWAGGSFDVNFKAIPARMNSGVAELDASAVAKGKLLKMGFPVFEARVSGKTPGKTEAVFKVGPWDILNEKRDGAISYERTWRGDFARVGVSFWIVNFAGGAGGSFSIKVSAQASPAGGMGSVEARGSVYGFVSAGIGIVVGGAELRSEIALLSPSIKTSLQVDVGGFEGSAEVCFEPVRLLIKLHVWAGIDIGFARWEVWSQDWNLIDWSAGRWCSTLFQL